MQPTEVLCDWTHGTVLKATAEPIRMTIQVRISVQANCVPSQESE